MSAGGKTEKAFRQKRVFAKMARNRTEIKQRQGSYELKRFVAALFLFFWTQCPEAERSKMESLRDVKRVMEREIEKGSCPLQFEYLEFGEKPFQFIESEEKLNEALSYLLRLGEYRGYTEHLVGNNVYMDLDMLCRKIQFKRTHSPVERSEIQWKIQRYKNKLKPDYAGKVCLEIVQCVFSLPEGAAEKYQIVYDGQKTYAFAMSNKYILGLFTHCEAARKSAVEDGVEFVHLPENEQKIVSLENVRNVLFQALLLDNVTVENGLFHAQMCTVMLLK